jgi:hypothetical protein
MFVAIFVAKTWLAPGQALACDKKRPFINQTLIAYEETKKTMECIYFAFIF